MPETLQVTAPFPAARPTAPLSAIAALIGGAVAMGLSPTIVRLADVGPFTSAFWRVFLALPVLWLWMVVAERADGTRKADRRSLSRPTILAGLAFGGDLLFWHLAILHTSIANATFFATLAPIWVVVFGWLLLREKVSRGVLLGLLLCLCGGAALVSSSLGGTPGHVEGDLYGVATGVMFGLYFLAVRAARADSGAARVTFELSLIAAALLGIVAVAFERSLLPQSLAGWEALFALAWISHAGGQGLLSIALGTLPAVFSSLVIFLEAIIAALFAWAILGEAVTGAQAVGGVLIVAGIWVGRPRKIAQPASK